jgi:hypothetical protein
MAEMPVLQEQKPADRREDRNAGFAGAKTGESAERCRYRRKN